MHLFHIKMKLYQYIIISSLTIQIPWKLKVLATPHSFLVKFSVSYWEWKEAKFVSKLQIIRWMTSVWDKGNCWGSVTKWCLTLAIPWTATGQTPLSSITSWSLLNSCTLGQWCFLTISSSVTHFCSCPQSFPASRSFPVS